MAKRVLLLSDISGEEGAETFSFSVGSDQYTMELLPKEIGGFVEAVQDFVDKATLVRGHRVSSNGEAAKVREWLKENGYEIGEKGRIPGVLQQIFDKAHADEDE